MLVAMIIMTVYSKLLSPIPLSLIFAAYVYAIRLLAHTLLAASKLRKR
jgi:hypothetical protein